MAIQTFRAIKLIERPQLEWDTENPVIPKQVGAYSTDTHQMKIGDGQKTYAELQFYDYEFPIPGSFYEHTKSFTPALSGGQHSYTVQKGVYHRTGEMVTARIKLQLAARDPGIVMGPLLITGLPYMAALDGPALVQIATVRDLTELDIGQVVGSIVEGTTTLQLHLQLADPMSQLPLTTDMLTDQTHLDLTCLYARSEAS